MIYYRIPPSSLLADYVNYFWVGEADASEDAPFVHWSIATSEPQLIFHYKGSFDVETTSGHFEKSFLAGIQGQSQTYARFVTCEKVGMFGVQFFPYTIPLLFSIPASEISDRSVDLPAFLGESGKDLQEKIFSAATNAERVMIMNRFLEQRLPVNQKSRAILWAIKHVAETKGVVNIAGLCNQTSLSLRQFERQFKAFAGFAPKLYARIIRFETAVDYYIHNKKTLTDIALICGYYDQPHFIHDCKSFTGENPKHYLQQWQSQLNAITNDAFLL
jgi:AraC-like DNA-binding protein